MLLLGMDGFLGARGWQWLFLGEGAAARLTISHNAITPLRGSCNC